MASIITHGVVAFTIGKLIPVRLPNAVLAAGVVMSMLPDADVITFAMGIPYESPLGHRGLSHSILFAVVIAILFTLLFKRKKHIEMPSFVIVFTYLFLSTVSHGILDAMTTGGLGVGFFIPFNDARYFFPYRFILVSPIGISGFLSSWGIAVLLSEIKTIWIPCIILFLAQYIYKRKFKANAT